MTLPEKCLLSVFERVRQKSTKKGGQSHYMGIKLSFTKNLPLSVFELLIYQNAKRHAKHPSWRNRLTLAKNMCFESF